MIGSSIGTARRQPRVHIKLDSGVGARPRRGAARPGGPRVEAGLGLRGRNATLRNEPRAKETEEELGVLPLVRFHAIEEQAHRAA